MSMSDPIADMLTRIRNAVHARHAQVEIPASNLKEQVCAVLKQEGYIEEYHRLADTRQGVLRVILRYQPDGKPVLMGLKRISKPSLRVHKTSTDIKLVRSGLGASVVSTSKGVMTGKQARAAHVGGEVLCEVW
jgi:small subunit ribosomal protein S8